MNDQHERLIDLARSARAAAVAADACEVERLTLELLTRLAIHLDDERLLLPELDWRDPDLADSLEDRQRLVLGHLFDLADEPLRSDDACRCTELANEIVALLSEEAAAEEQATAAHGLP